MRLEQAEHTYREDECRRERGSCNEGSGKNPRDLEPRHSPSIRATALVRAGVASLDRVAQDGVRVRASAGAASFRRHSTLQECRCKAEKAVHDLRTQLDTDPGAASRKQAAARRRAAEDRERRVRAALAVTEELHAKQQEVGRHAGQRSCGGSQ